jgi:allantoinase
VLAEGLDADFVVFDPDPRWTVTHEALRFRHSLSPYLGETVFGRVQETWLRGERIFADGRFAGTPRGRELVRA